MARRLKAPQYPHADDATQYARDIVSGIVAACKWVRLAAKRHLDDLEQQKDPSFPYYWDPQGCDDLCAFLECLTYTQGEWAGKLIKLQPWQKFVYGVPFGWFRREDKLRRYREIFLGVPRKNGKSEIIAGIGLFLLCADGEPGAKIYCGATSLEQAGHVFLPARTMASYEKRLSEAFGLEVGVKSISIRGTTSHFIPVISKPGEGGNPHGFLLDEYHEADSDEQYSSLKTGTAARRQPMGVIITTAGRNVSSPCYKKWKDVEKMLDGIISMPDVWGVIYTTDPGDDWKDFAAWEKSNPNLGVSIYRSAVESEYLKAMRDASAQNEILRTRLNIWTNASVGWVNMAKWEECADPSLTLDAFKDIECWIGVDLASKVDLAAMMYLFRIPATHEFARFVKSNYVLFGNYYLPEETIERPENAHYRQWRDMGLLTSTPGARTDFNYLEDDLKAANAVFKIQELAYDPREAEYLMQSIREWSSFECVEVSQSPANLSEPMKEFEALYLSGKLKHNGCPLLKWQASNVVLRNSRNKSFYPAKERAESKIDGIVAAIIALSRAMVVKTVPHFGMEVW